MSAKMSAKGMVMDLKLDLDSMKYKELQRLAKSVGIRANQKIEILLKALKQHESKKSKEDGSTPSLGTRKDKNLTAGQNLLNKISASANIGISSPIHKFEKRSSAKLFSPRQSQFHGKCSPALQSPRISNGQNKTQKLQVKKIQDTSSEYTTNITPEIAGRRKRRRTYELDEATTPNITPSADDVKRDTRARSSLNTSATAASEQKENASKRFRKMTYDKSSPCETAVDNTGVKSPGTQAMIESMDGHSSSADRKAKLLSALNKKVEVKVTASPAQGTEFKPSNIPRFIAFLANKKKNETQKPDTPGNKDWTKVHKKAFAKFDSIDVYLEKKKIRREQLSSSAKKTDNIKCSARNVNKITKPEMKPQGALKPFIPTVTSTKDINFNFSKSGVTNINNKTPVARPPISKPSKTPVQKKRSLTSVINIDSTNRATPFKFTGNTSNLNATMNSHKKVFDLKASLARPMTWKPHTGKLQPLDINSSTAAPTTKSSVKVNKTVRPSRQSRVNRTRPTQAKDIHRAKQLDRRNNQKYIDMMKRRGLMA